MSTPVTVHHDKSNVLCNVDVAQPIEKIIKTLCIEQFNIQEPAALYALRLLDTDELITDENLRRKIKENERLKLVSSPLIEAAEICEKLGSNDDKVLKLATFSLQKYIKEVEFADEFLKRSGLKSLIDIINNSSGNTLAYALTSMQNLMEHDHGWEDLSFDFINKVINILVKQTLVNICRPATAIIIKLATADKNSTTSAIKTYGFDVLHDAMIKQPNFFSTLVQRLSSADYVLCSNSLCLINALMRHVTDHHWESFMDMMIKLKVRKAVALLMNGVHGDELSKHLLEFQSLFVRQAYRWKRTQVSLHIPSHKAMLEELWAKANLPEEGGKWRKIGFATEAPKWEIQRVGYLGLENMHGFMKKDIDDYQKTILEQHNRPAERRCPFAKTSIEVTELLCDYWDVSTGYTTSTSFQPLLLAFEKIHYITVKSFFRLWNEMEATVDDFPKVSALVRSQLKFALRDEATKQLYEFEKDMLEVEYKVIRDRQLKELELGDDLLSKTPVRNLRSRLYTESYEFVKNQRIKCLLIGDWFQITTTTNVPSNSTTNLGKKTMINKKWRFYRLSPNLKFLHYSDFLEKTFIRDGIEDLPERIDLSLVTDIMTGPSPQIASTIGSPPKAISKHLSTNIIITNNNLSQDLTFSLMSGPDTVLTEFIARDYTQYSEWTDGLNMLFDKNINSKDTAEYIHILTEIGVKVKLLDLSGEKVEIPQNIEVPNKLPIIGTGGSGFYYDDPFS
ncbi:ELMO/CED-12 family-domain-containing protein [Rhizophagus diaphanus]|nr:ELMO/CED-12 family-domain-containing protein [Rhizophagus diaphanus] [Rhizophagus sp. MUCL 43196]